MFKIKIYLSWFDEKNYCGVRISSNTTEQIYDNNAKEEAVFCVVTKFIHYRIGQCVRSFTR
jgi:hypothetical protein